ncbi:MAG: endonuclease III [Candidatus Babeliaceae bacterium]|nr:endonuclease III [Candidatus Babeliaceae bacterium]
MTNQSIKEYGQKILKTLESALVGKVPEPMSLMLVQDFGRDPYLILIACLLSLRSRDVVTYHVCKDLFRRVKTPEQMLKIPQKDLEVIIHKIGFFRRKATILKEVSQQLIDQFNGKVPKTLEKLLSIKGIGRKTANLVLAEAFDQPAICVDVHVHRLSNQLYLVHTNKPDETEFELQKIFPPHQWREINRLFVMLGQNSCQPMAQNCNFCIFLDYKKIHLRFGIKVP